MNVLMRPLYTDECLETIDRWEGEFSKPGPENRKKNGIRVFRNAIIENVLAKSHPIIPGLWVIPLGAWGVYRGITGGHQSVLGTLGLFTLGVLLWSLLEYVLHRFVFHLEPKDPPSKVRQFMMHGYHHEFPNDKMRLVAPPLMSGVYGVIVSTLFYFIFGDKYWLQVFSGTLYGYLFYDWTHYYTHHFTPTNPVGKWLRSYHLQHHFQDDFSRYGISSPLWDLVFRTYRPAGRSDA